MNSVNKKIILVSRCSQTLWIFRRHLADELKKSNWQVILLGGSMPKYDALLQAAGLDFRAIKIESRSYNPIHDLKLIWSLWKIYRKERPDVVHNFTIKPVIFSSLAAYFAGVAKVVSTVTGLGHVFISAKPWAKAVACNLYRLAFLVNHRVIFQNPDDQKLFTDLKILSKRKSKVILGSGVDTDHFKPRSKSQQNFKFLMIGRLLIEKGIVEYLSASESLSKKYPNIEFGILGDIDPLNPSSIKSEEIDKWSKISQIKFYGHQDDVRDYIAQSDVVVLPSYREGVPKSLIEAAAMGKPLIATHVSGCIEVVKPGLNGLLAAPRDAKSLEISMESLLSNQEKLASMGSESRRLALEAFDMKKINQIQIETYFG